MAPSWLQANAAARKVYLETIITDVNYLDYQPHDCDSNIPTGIIITDVHFLDYNKPTDTFIDTEDLITDINFLDHNNHTDTSPSSIAELNDLTILTVRSPPKAVSDAGSTAPTVSCTDPANSSSSTNTTLPYQHQSSIANLNDFDDEWSVSDAGTTDPAASRTDPANSSSSTYTTLLTDQHQHQSSIENLNDFDDEWSVSDEGTTAHAASCTDPANSLSSIADLNDSDTDTITPAASNVPASNYLQNLPDVKQAKTPNQTAVKAPPDPKISTVGSGPNLNNKEWTNPSSPVNIQQTTNPTADNSLSNRPDDEWATTVKPTPKTVSEAGTTAPAASCTDPANSLSSIADLNDSDD